MTVSQRQVNTGLITTGTSLTVTLPSPVLAGSCIVVQIAVAQSYSLASISDSSSNSYSPAFSPLNGTGVTGEFSYEDFAQNVPASSSLTVTVNLTGSGSVANTIVVVRELTGVVTTGSPIGLVAAAVTSSSATPSLSVTGTSGANSLFTLGLSQTYTGATYTRPTSTGITLAGAADYSSTSYEFDHAAATSGTITNPTINWTASPGTTTNLSFVEYLSGVATTTIAPNNSAIVYSPYNWNVTGSVATTINTGAYFRTMFSGTTCALKFDVSNMGSNPSQIWWRIDFGTWTKAPLAATVTLTIPSDLNGNSAFAYHYLEVVAKSFDTTINRWNTATTSGTLKLTSIVLDASAAVAAPAVLPTSLLIYGDSITEGYFDLGNSEPTQPDQIDGQQSWAYKLREYLGCEVGVIGFAGAGFAVSGNGGAPALLTSYNLIYQGQTRTYSPAPSLVLINHGYNDYAQSASTSTVTTDAQTVLSALLTACPSCPIIVLAPLPSTGAGYLTAIQTAVTNIASTRLTYSASTGIFNGSYGTVDGIHPSGANNQAFIGPAVAAILRSHLSSGGAAGMLFAPNMDGI